jgi:curved DNA-binding protein CbpA
MDKKEALKILELNSDNPTSEQIKIAYRRLSLKWHPDRLSGQSSSKIATATEKFQKISEAYSTLSGSGGSDGFDNSEDIEFLVKAEVRKECRAYDVEVEEVYSERHQEEFKNVKNRTELDQVMQSFSFWIQAYSWAVKTGYIKRKQKLNKTQQEQIQNWYNEQKEAIEQEIKKMEELSKQLDELERLLQQKKEKDLQAKKAAKIISWLIIILLGWWAVKKIINWIKGN